MLIDIVNDFLDNLAASQDELQTEENENQNWEPAKGEELWSLLELV